MMRFRGRGRLAAATLAMALLAAACGGEDEPDVVEEPPAEDVEPTDEEPADEEPADEEPADEEPADEPEAEGAGEAAASEGCPDWEPEYVDGVLQPLPDGFPNQEITIVSVDEPGSRDGVYARTLDSALEGISPVDIRVSDEPEAVAGTVSTLADTLTREGGEEGYFPVITSVQGTAGDWHAIPLEEEFGLGLEDVNFFIVTETHPWIIVQRTDAPWGVGFEAMVEYARENPGEVEYLVGDPGGGSNIMFQWLINGLGIEVQQTPAGDREAATAAVAAGEGDITITQPGVAQQAGDRLHVIYATTAEVPDDYADEEGIVSANDLDEFSEELDQTAWGSFQGMMLPAVVPDCHDAWLHELFRRATEEPAYQEREEQINAMQIDLYTSEEAQEIARTGYELMEPIVRDMGLHHEQQ